MKKKQLCSCCHHLLTVKHKYFYKHKNGKWYAKCIPCTEKEREKNYSNKKTIITSEKTNLENNSDHKQQFEKNSIKRRESIQSHENKIIILSHEKKQIKKQTFIKKLLFVYNILKKIDMEIIKHQKNNYKLCKACPTHMIPYFLFKKRIVNNIDISALPWLYCSNDNCPTLKNFKKREVIYYYNPWSKKDKLSLENFLLINLNENEKNILKRTVEWKYLFFCFCYIRNDYIHHDEIKNINTFKIAYCEYVNTFAKKLNLNLNITSDQLWAFLLYFYRKIIFKDNIFLLQKDLDQAISS